MCRSQSLMCYLSQMLCVLLVPLACAAGRHALWLQAHNGTGAALLPVGTALQWLMEAQEWNVRCAKQKWEQSYSFQPLLKAHVFYLSINTFFNCFIQMEKNEGAESPGKTRQRSGCASVKFGIGARWEEELMFVGNAGRWGFNLSFLNITRKKRKIEKKAGQLRGSMFTSPPPFAPSPLPVFYIYFFVYISHL